MLSDYTTKTKNISKGLSRFINTSSSSSIDTNSSSGLLDIAKQSGFSDDAQRIVSKNQGETNQIFSGGVVSDFFDVLNSLDYGVVGMLKGKTFLDGVKNRESFADEDALGKNLGGKVFGTVLDIAVDPLTYIAPATVLNKIPGATKLGKALKTATFGKMVPKIIEGTDKTVDVLEGGLKPAKFLADKLAYMFGKDPIYRKTWEKAEKNIAVGQTFIKSMSKGILNLPKEKAEQLLARDETGRFIRKGIDQLKDFTPQEIKNVSEAYNYLDNLGKQAVDLGLLSKGKWEENVGEYLKSTYKTYEEGKKGGVFGFLQKKVSGIKERKNLTETEMKALGQIDNPAYLYFKSTSDLAKDIENTKFFNEVADKFGTDVAQDGFTKLPDSKRLFTTATGEKINLLTKVKEINTKLKFPLKELKNTFKADREVLSKIDNLEKELSSLGDLRIEEFNKFFQEPLKAVKTTEGKQIIKGVGKLPDNLKEIGNSIKGFTKLSDLMKSDIGIKLEKMFEQGILERSGFKTIEDLFNFVKTPYKATTGVTKEIIQKDNLGKLVNIQKQIEELIPKLENIKGIDKRSIDDSYRFLEDAINKINVEKEGVFEQIGKIKLGELSGKYVPDAIYKDIAELTKPASDMEKWLDPLVGNFKFFKVVMNPASHIRNIMSNKLLNNFDEAGMPLWRLDKDMQGWKSAITKDKWYQEVEKLGGNVDTFTAQELGSILTPPSGVTGKALQGWNKTKEFLGDLYQREEMGAKMSMYRYQREVKGLNPEDAWKIAERATFNYAQVTPFVRRLRSNLFGAPFITFTVKATPVIAKTVLKNPTKISNIGKIRNSIESLADIKETERERASEPEWVKNGFYVKLPMKDKNGRSAYFDLTYILPFGDLVNLGDETQLNIFSKSPALNFIKEIGSNKDFYGNNIWRESDPQSAQVADLMRHITKTYLPPMVADQIPGGYSPMTGVQTPGKIVSALGASAENQKRNLAQEIARMAGMKIQPINADIQETYQEWNTKRDLQKLLQENGVLKEFSTMYKPKNN